MLSRNSSLLPRRWAWSRATRRRLAAVVLPVSTTVVAGLLNAVPAQAADGRDHTGLQKAKYGKAEPFDAKAARTPDPTVAAERRTLEKARAKVEWPNASAVKVRSAKGTRAAVEDTPKVRVLDRRATTRLGIDGLVFTVVGGEADKAATTVDYSSFADAYSGNWSSRLRVVRLPECALTTPEQARCRTTTPVASENDAEAETVTAQVTRGSSAKATPMVLALSAAASSDQGTYEATPLASSSTWAAGGSNGDFTWNYPLETPPAPAGPSPNLSIGYSAQSVDGRTSSTSAQPSWIGEGFDLPVSYIERAYASCEDDGQDKKYDLCWKEDNASLVLNGKSTPLVKGSDGTWRPKSDDGERVVRGTGAANGDDGDTDDKGEFWTVTGTDGTQYVFGKNRLPGWSSGKDETNSVWTAPVFGDDSGEPGYSSGDSYSSRAKTQAWRWNLDYVVDPHGNVMTYWYDKELNHYAKNGTTGNGTAYARGGWLKRIDYGQRNDTVFTQPASARVKFTVAERCLPVSGGETCGSSHRPTATPGRTYPST